MKTVENLYTEKVEGGRKVEVAAGKLMWKATFSTSFHDFVSNWIEIRVLQDFNKEFHNNKLLSEANWVIFSLKLKRFFVNEHNCVWFETRIELGKSSRQHISHRCQGFSCNIFMQFEKKSVYPLSNKSRLKKTS